MRRLDGTHYCRQGALDENGMLSECGRPGIQCPDCKKLDKIYKLTRAVTVAEEALSLLNEDTRDISERVRLIAQNALIEIDDLKESL